MVKKAILAFTVLCGAWGGYTLYHTMERSFSGLSPIFGQGLFAAGSGAFAVLGGLLFGMIGVLSADRVTRWLHSLISSFSRIPMNELAAGTAGLLSGLL
ncbi:twitching motility protein PilT, partial [Clostridium perfringens]